MGAACFAGGKEYLLSSRVSAKAVELDSILDFIAATEAISVDVQY